MIYAFYLKKNPKILLSEKDKTNTEDVSNVTIFTTTDVVESKIFTPKNKDMNQAIKQCKYF